MDEAQRNKQVIRALLAAVDAGDLETVLSFYAPSYVDHDASESRATETTHREALVHAFRAFYGAFEGTEHTIHDLIAEGDRVAARLSATAVHTGEILGVAATHRAISNESLVIYRLEDGKIVERWCRERRTTRDLLLEAQPLS